MKKYIALKDELLKIIEISPPHTMLPSHHQIMEKYKVSDTTVRKTLSELDKDGLIYTHHGKGRFVSPKSKFYPEVYCVFDSLYMDDENNFEYIYPKLIDYISTEFLNNDFEMLLSLYKNNTEIEKQVLERLPDKRPFGTILLYSGFEESVKYYQRAIDMVPNAVFVDRYIDNFKVSYVGTDNEKATADMVEKIKNERFDTVFIVGEFDAKLSSERDRAVGYLKALQNTVNKDNVILTCINTFEKENANILDLIKDPVYKNKKICICFHNSFSFRLFYEVYRHKIGEFDYLKIFTFDMPLKEKPKKISITYAKQSLSLIAKEAVRIIKENNKSKERVLIPATIIDM